MSDNVDALEKAKARALKRAQEREQAEARERAENARIRKLERALLTRQATILGETIRDAKLSDEERSVISRVLLRRSDRPKDWEKIRQFLLPDAASIAANHGHAELPFTRP
jgi:hypothetical protein